MNTTQKTIRAIFIQPLQKLITEIQMPDDFDGMKRDYLKCHTAQPVDGGASVDIWIDENGLLAEDWSTVGFTQLSGTLELAGNLILIGRDAERAMCDLTELVNVDMVKRMCRFIPHTQVKVRGTTFTTYDEKGNPTTESIGPEYLTSENH